MSAEPRDRIRDYLQRATRQTDFGDDVNIFEMGIATSLFAVELVAFVETEFDIEIEDEDLDLDNFNSIDVLTNLVTRKTGKTDAAA